MTWRTLPLLLLAPAFAAELPVRQVILYKHGVGYFERSGTVPAGEIIRLEFKPAEMDDVLKSLTVQEAAGGKISGVRYDSSEPLEKRLSEFPFSLAPESPLSVFLDSLRGAPIELNSAGQTLRGTIVSGRRTAATADAPEREFLVLLQENGDLRNVDLASVTSLQLRDAGLRAKLQEYLSRIDQSRSTEKRAVYIDVPGGSENRISVNYVVPSPAWKSSYRLLLTDKDALMEGWAIVDNTTGEDWNQVRLSVVSGRPVSFVSRLYEPKYVTRPGAELPEDRAQAPAVHAGGLDDAVALRAQPAPALRARIGGNVAAAEGAMAAPSSVAEVAAARDIGELFEYGFPSPVTVRKGESAMLPFLQQKVQARKLLIYTGSPSEHPLNAVEIVNDTGKTLDGGPVTVYDFGAYGGEALLETLKSSDKRLISYATDLGTRITTKFGSRSEVVREVHFRRGVLYSRRALQETRVYTIRNADQKPKTLIIEHQARAGYELVGPKPVERTASAYRFEVRLGPGASAELPVGEERVLETSYTLDNLTPDLLLSFVQNKALNAAAQKQLQAVIDQKRRIADTDKAIAQAAQEFESLTADQNRLRQNIESLNRVAGQQEQVQQYARQLAAQEARLAELRDRQAELRQKKAALELELNSLIEKIDF